MAKRKAYGYIRVSSGKQLKGGGPERQRDSILKYAAENDIEIVRFYTDSVSGTKELFERPGWMDLQIDIEETNEVSLVIVEKLDRLSRKSFVQDMAFRELDKRKVSLDSYCEGEDLASKPVDPRDITRNLQRQIMAAISEYEAAILAYRMRAKRERNRKKNGKCEGRKGYRDKCPHLHWNAWWLWEELEEDFPKATTRCKAIAQVLNDCAIPTFEGGEFDYKIVNKMLQKAPAPYRTLKRLNKEWRPFPES